METETPAVTEQDSAPVTTEATPSDVQEFADYQREANQREIARRRGESAPSEEKEEKAEKETPAAKEDSATSQESEIAAASEAAPTEQEQRETRRSPQAGENRWAKLSRENKELRERLARLEEAGTQRETRQESQPAAEAKPEAGKKAAPKPTLQDKDDKGQPKYKTYEEFLDARDEWVREEIKRENAEAAKETAKQHEREQAESVVRQEMVKRVEKARTKYQDFDSVALNPKLPIKQGSAVHAYTLESDLGTDVLYHLGKNPKELERIQGKPVFQQDGITILRFQGGLSPIAQVRELAKIEAKLSAPPAQRRITQAPPPPRVLGNNAATSADEVEQALKEDDYDSYKAAANARDLARRRGK